jgi:hypothetical protein
VLTVACGEDSGTSNGQGNGGSSGAGAMGGAGGSGGSGATGGGAGNGGQAPVCPEFSLTPGALPEIGLTILVESPDLFGLHLVGVVSGQVYFHDDDLLQRVAIAGGTPEQVAPLTGFAPRLRGSDLLYWTEQESITAPSRIVTAPLSDPTAVSVLAENIVGLEHLQVDETHAYWATRDPANIHRVPLSGGAPAVFVAGGRPLGSLLHQGYYWWHDFQTSSLERIALAGGTRERLVEIHYGGPMAGDNEAVYWGDTSLNSIEKWSAADGRIKLSSGEPSFVAVADGTVYWTDGFIGGSLRSVRTDGSDDKQLLCGLRHPESLFVDGSYLVVSSDESILRIDR